MEDCATILEDQFLFCVANKLSVDNANMIRGELSEVLRHYKIEPAGETMIYAKVDQNNVKTSHKKNIFNKFIENKTNYVTGLILFYNIV